MSVQHIQANSNSGEAMLIFGTVSSAYMYICSFFLICRCLHAILSNGIDSVLQVVAHVT